MDNLFLVRDVIDICKLFNLNVGILSLDQEKAFDRIDHSYRSSVFRAFGVVQRCKLYGEGGGWAK